MDLIFLQKPVLLLFVLGAVLLHVASYFLRNGKLMVIADVLNIALHSAAITAVFMNGGKLEDALVLVLFSSFAALLRCEKPQKTCEGEKEENK